MPKGRFFVSETFVESGRISLGGGEHHHAARVMRVAKDSVVEVVNGRGELAHACVESVGASKTLLRLLRIERVDPLPCRLTLAQALPLPNRLAVILEKGTELGASAFVLFPGERSQKTTLTPLQLERAYSVVVAALKQCGRLWLPSIALVQPLARWSSFEGLGLFGDLDPSAPTLLDVVSSSMHQDITFFVGPESGFSRSEVETLRALGAQGVKLADAILRTDTAPLVALSLLGHLQICRQG